MGRPIKTINIYIMKTKFLFITFLIFCISQTNAQLVVGDSFNDGALTFKVENLTPLEANVTGFSGATVTNLVIPNSASSGAQTFSVVGVANNAFQAKGVVTVTFPSTLRSIGAFAFQGNGSTLISFNLTNPSALTYIGATAFAANAKLTSVNLSNTSVNFTATETNIFNNCTGITSFEMKNNTVVTLLPPAFLGTCSSLITADFSGCTNITSLSDNVFRNNSSLIVLYLGSDTPPTITSGTSGTFAGMSLTPSSRILKVPTNTGVSNFSALTAWTSLFGNIRIDQEEVQVTERPMIWVKDSEKQFILDEINNNSWKTAYFNAFRNRVKLERDSYMANRAGYLSQLPYAAGTAGQIPPFKKITDSQSTASADRTKYKNYLQSGIDSGVLYFLTGDEDYAKYSASIFYTFMKAMNKVALSDTGNFNAGWIYPADHLREARDIGAQMPILYDFIATYIKNGGTAYDYAANSEVTINRLEAEAVFKNYIFLAKYRGGVESNWAALESSSLACNTLALDSKTERDAEILFAINKTASNQIPLSTMSQVIQDKYGIWPEPFTYAKYVAEFSTYVMTLVTKYDSSFDLANKYINIPLSEEIPNDFTYPNGNRTLHFGDGSRGYARYTEGYEVAYYLGKLTNNTTLLDKFGKLINSSVSFGNYNRQKTLSSTRSTEVEPYFEEALRLLWYSGTVDGAATKFEQNVTNKLAFAGLSMQRNIATPDPTLNGLMCFVGGAGYVHSYASGMNMELYGPKTVIGAAAGNTQSYGLTIHKNYYRLFAAHNTVIVNGASQGDGGNGDIDINTVTKLSIEPEYKELPVSPKNSFSTSSFRDDKGTLAEAFQHRTMAIVRTSPTSGYYVDVFKSNSSLANEYHDYVYHNISEVLELQSNGSTLPLTTDATRYANGNISGGFANPGWQYFTNIQTSGVYAGDVIATFTATGLGGSVGMKMHIPGEINREYTTVMAPPTLGVTTGYNTKDTPTVVVRQNGEAWKTPFAVVYEPYNGTNTSTVTKVTSIKRLGDFSGMQVESTVSGKNIKQIILLTDNDDGVFNDVTLGVELTGRFIVLSMDENDALTSIYMGKGSRIKYKGWEVTTKDGLASNFYIEISNKNAKITTNSELVYTYPTDITLSISDNTFLNTESSFIVYQNRNSSIWNIQTKNLDLNNANVKIINFLGVTVLSKEINSSSTEIDLGSVPSGFYIVQMTNNNAVVDSKKIIVGM